MYIYIAFRFQIMIYRPFYMLFNIFLFIFPDGVLNIGTQVWGLDELKWHFLRIDNSETDSYKQVQYFFSLITSELVLKNAQISGKEKKLVLEIGKSSTILERHFYPISNRTLSDAKHPKSPIFKSSCILIFQNYNFESIKIFNVQKIFFRLNGFKWIDVPLIQVASR